MASLLRVPFGLRPGDRIWVGPEDVAQRGLACGCICPFCELPLKKNICTDRVDHFSHHTRGQQDKVAHGCEYSFWVACATMGRQLLEQGGSLKTPEYNKTLTMPVGYWWQFHDDLNTTVAIATASVIGFKPNEVSIGKTIDQRTTDAVITVHGIRVLVFLTHPEREQKNINIDDISREKTAALVIDMSKLFATYKAMKGSESFKEKIHICLFEDINNKCWLWHPREARLIAKAEEELKQTANSINRKRADNTTILRNSIKNHKLQESGTIYSVYVVMTSGSLL